MKLMNVLTLIIVLPSLTSCGLTTRFLQKPTPVFPPEQLLKECNKTSYEGSTYKDVIEYAIDLQSDIDKCNEDKTALRNWKTDNDTTNTIKKSSNK